MDPGASVSELHRIAVVDEAACIGCTLCLAACPVEAICGAPRRMHAVIAAWCTGCELCIAPCPVDCIAMRASGRRWSPADTAVERQRRDVHALRRPRSGTRSGLRDVAQEPLPAAPPAPVDTAFRQRAVAGAFARARARRTPEAAR